MDVKQIRSSLLCGTCIFFMPGSATEFSTDVLYEIFSRRMDDVMLEHKLLRLEFDEAVRNMGNQADRITNVEDATNKMEKQADKMASFEEAINKIEEQAIKISNVEETAKRMEKQADKMASFEEAITKIEKQAVKISTLEETTKKMEKKADKISNLEAALNKFEEQDDIIANLEESTIQIEKHAERITSLEEAINEIKKQADKIAHLEEVTKKMEKQVDRITKLEDCVKKIEHNNTEVTNIEKEVQDLNNKIEDLESNTLNNEKAISDVTRLATENVLKALKVSESSINAIKDNVTRQSVAVRKMLSAEKMFLRGVKKSLHDKFSNFTNEVKLQLSTLNVSVESQVSSFKTILKVSEKSENKLETLQDEMGKKFDHHRNTLNKTNGEIQQLKTRIVNVEARQGKRAAFTVTGASTQYNGILKFSKVHLNEESAFDTTTGQFTSPYTGIYGFTASIFETGGDNNYIECSIRKNNYIYAYMYFEQGYADGKFVLNGSGAATAAITIHLAKGDRVHVRCPKGLLYGSSFTGFLISPDP
ncbi:uncharacterized protein LOC128553273 [Mercenaria mercenaria]|uniref:uncharacterized protein LOC128553273 n=1 Tax=Mercenaria mercenaria TaxID=6596 RepID=UPI00234EA04A|nr:uncharacterized protein LOC128553273 [Mercenaria mercenaria]